MLLLLFISNQFVNSCHSSLMLCLVFQNGVDPKPVLGFGSSEEMTDEIWKKTEHLYLSKEQNIRSHRSSENLEKETINHLLTAMKRGLHRESEDFLADIYFQICLF